MLRTLVITLLLLPAIGCSSLGLTLYPTGHFLTEQTEQVLAQSVGQADLPKELSKSVLAAHYLEPGDVLLIEPVDFESDIRIPADQHVLADGSIDLGGFGRAVVAGLTLEDAEELIEQTIVHSGTKQTEINIRLLESVHRFYVLGEVNSPGAYPLEGNETVLDAILTAGGLTDDASPCKLLLARPTNERSCRITLPICYREITQLGDSSSNYQLMPGDRVFVASRTFCEELMCCLATETCDRCCKCQAACSEPSLVQRGNSYPRIPEQRATASWKSRTDDENEPDQTNDSGNPLTDLPSAENQLLAPALPVQRIPAVAEGFGVGREGAEANLKSDTATGDRLDGQLPPVVAPPEISDSFDQ